MTIFLERENITQIHREEKYFSGIHFNKISINLHFLTNLHGEIYTIFY